jgi:flagellar biosynthesis/type III secretory pathway protein FliH
MLDHGKKKVGKDLYQAKQDAEHILLRAEGARKQRLAEGKRQAAQAHEESMARGAADAFADAAAEALSAFRRRADRYAEAAEDIRVLAIEVCKKVLGGPPDLGPKDVDAILRRGLAQLRARRRLRLQVGERRLAELSEERPNLMKALVNEPDLLVEAVDDVSVGFARVVTEIGGALCAEQTALDALAQAVNVKETPRKRAPHDGATHVGVRPSTRSFEAAKNAPLSELPEANLEESLDSGEATFVYVPKSPGHAAAASIDDVDGLEEIEASEDVSRTTRRQHFDSADGGSDARAEDDRDAGEVTPVQPHPRASARSPSKSVATAQRGHDDDLALFTDSAVPIKKPRR